MAKGKITEYGVCYDVRNSPYVYEWRSYRFHFSSVKHLEKFRDNVRMREEWLEDSLTRRFKYRVHAAWLAVFQLYAQVETRGFYVEAYYGSTWEALEEVEFNVTPMMNSSQWGE